MAEETGFKNKIIRAFGLEDLDDEYGDGYGDEQYYTEETELEEDPETVEPGRYASPGRQSRVVTNDGSPDVLVLNPTNFDEAPGIVNQLKQNKTIVVNLKETDYEEGQKIFDFLSGAVFALEGSLNRIAESVFILAPQMVHVSTEMEEAKSSRSGTMASWETK